MPYRPHLACQLTRAERNSAGVFVLRNAQDARVYVGAAKHLGRACARTRYELRQGRHAAHQLQAHATAHGLASLRFEVLEFCPVGQLPAARQRQVAAHRATDPAHGFNTLASAAFTPGQPLSEAHRARISAGKRGQPHRPGPRATSSAAIQSKAKRPQA